MLELKHSNKLELQSNCELNAKKEVEMEIQTTKLNGGELYFQIIHEISPKVNNYIQDQIKELKLSENLETMLLKLPEKRKHTPIMRSNLTYLTYKTFGGQASIEELVPALAISELSNYFPYLDNWIFDNKNDCCSSRDNINMVVATSEIFRELTQKTIENLATSDETKRKISQTLIDASIKSYDGQTKDFGLTTEKINEFRSDEEFTKFYKNRARLLSGALYGVSAEIGALLAAQDEKAIQKARQFGEIFGTGLHTSNDLGDFALFLKEDSFRGAFRSYQDQLSDIMENRLTFPIFYILKHGSEEQVSALKKLIGNRTAALDEKKQASLAVLNSGAYKETKSMLNEYEHQLKTAIKEFPDNEYRDALSSMISILGCNKYLTALKKLNEGN